jgi:sugar lactone lactonase YvrE
MADEITCIQQANAILGEGPVWDWRSGDVYWVDIRRMQVFRHALSSGMQTGQWAFRARVGFVALTTSPGWLAVGSGLEVLLLDTKTGRTVPLADLESHRQGHRINDASVDAAGRLWVGTMMDDFFGPEAFTEGRLYRVDPDGGVYRQADEYQLPNGIGWSPDNATMYINDSVARVTYALDFDAAKGSAVNRRPLFSPIEESGLPDGLSVDADGTIWCAMWDGWAILRLAPDGSILERHQMPVRRPSSATFGGSGLDQLLITSATVGFTSEDYASSPLAGGLFRMSAGSIGQRANLFATSGTDVFKALSKRRTRPGRSAGIAAPRRCCTMAP